ncbi:MAG: YagK/YfjJ domain-containing protein [Pseudomonas sp.]
MKKLGSYTSLSQSDIAIQIYRLVQAIERHDTPAFRIKSTRSGSERIENTWLSRYFDHITPMVDLFNGRCEYRYSAHLKAFWEACQDIGLERHTNGPVCLNEAGTAYLDHHSSMNVLVDQIRMVIGKKWYRRQEGDRIYEARQQGDRVAEYGDIVLERHACTTVVRVDLYYYQHVQTRLRVEDVFDDLDSLIATRERDSVFDHETGYVCSVEQGKDRGYHIHAVFFFNSAKVQGDIRKGRQIGQLWKRITEGQGYYNNCNQDKEKYKDRLGIGLIHRHDLKIRPHFHYAMQYLVKDEQEVLLRPLGARCLRMGRS